jgi:hypothetical protein
MFLTRNSFAATALSLLAAVAVIAPAYAETGPYYNCSADSTFFSVDVVKNAAGKIVGCTWNVRTGEEQGPGGYTPSVTLFSKFEFPLDKKNITQEDCEPTTLNALEMQADYASLECFFAPKGEPTKEIVLESNNLTDPLTVEQYQGGQWVNVGSACQGDTKNCRAAVTSQAHK